VPWTCALPDFALQDDRDQCMAAIAPFAGQLTFLATKFGRTRSPKALSTLMQVSCRTAGIPVSAHGLRKSRSAALADHGASTHEIAAWTGHLTLTEITRYTQSTNRRRAVMGTVAEPTLETLADKVETRA
jgi:integrase/recombinase XerD